MLPVGDDVAHLLVLHPHPASHAEQGDQGAGDAEQQQGDAHHGDATPPSPRLLLFLPSGIRLIRSIHMIFKTNYAVICTIHGLAISISEMFSIKPLHCINIISLPMDTQKLGFRSKLIFGRVNTSQIRQIATALMTFDKHKQNRLYSMEALKNN